MLREQGGVYIRREFEIQTPRYPLKAMDGIGVVMTPFGDVVTVSLVVNICVL